MGNPQTASTSALAGSPTAMLFSLPSELLLLIFTFVGFLNFRQDLRRLAVSKEWYPYARSTLLSHLRLHSQDLLPILGAMRNSTTQAAAQQLTKHIDLTLCAVGLGRISVPGPRPRILESLEQLASMLKDFTALRTLIIRSKLCMSRLPTHVVPSFASLSQLTSLEMDLVNIGFERDTHFHLCEFISQLIPKLKSLRCRLPCICDKILESPPGDLKELIISMHGTGWNVLTESCTTYSYDGLRTSLETGLLRFAASMCDPKVVRLIYIGWEEGFACVAFDAIQARRLILLTDRPDWDEDGLPMIEGLEDESSWGSDDFDDEENFGDEENSDNEDNSDDEGMNQGDNNSEIFEDEEDEEE